jgi:hypothetical protein
VNDQVRAPPRAALLSDISHFICLRLLNTQHSSAFADEHNLTPYLLSAKSGDRVVACFSKVAADLAGVILSHGRFLLTRHKKQETRNKKKKNNPIDVFSTFTCDCPFTHRSRGRGFVTWVRFGPYAYTHLSFHLYDLIFFVLSLQYYRGAGCARDRDTG